MTEHEERQAVAAEALTWQGTPFAWEQCVKGLGVDCGRFLAASCNGAGVKNIDIKKLPRLSPQWFLHRADESFIKIILQFAAEYHLEPGRKPRTGDIIVARFGRDWGHSAIVLDWPRVIGAANEHCVTIWENVHRSPQYGSRQLRYFNPWGKPNV